MTTTHTSTSIIPYSPVRQNPDVCAAVLTYLHLAAMLSAIQSLSASLVADSPSSAPRSESF